MPDVFSLSYKCFLVLLWGSRMARETLWVVATIECMRMGLWKLLQHEKKTKEHTLVWPQIFWAKQRSRFALKSKVRWLVFSQKNLHPSYIAEPWIASFPSKSMGLYLSYSAYKATWTLSAYIRKSNIAYYDVSSRVIPHIVWLCQAIICEIPHHRLQTGNKLWFSSRLLSWYHSHSVSTAVKA